MREGYDESPLNPVPPVVWLLALPVIASEAVFGLSRMGFLAAQGGPAMRQIAVKRAEFAPEFLLRMWERHEVALPGLARLLTYPFVHYSFTHALFVAVFLLALGNSIAHVFRFAGVLGLFFGSAIGGALVYTLLAAALPGARFEPLVGGYPAVYGMLGGFTFLLWMRLAAEHAHRMRAFTLIGALMLFQLVFGALFGGMGMSWLADLAGFACGFLLSFVLIPGGWARVRAHLRER